MPAVGHRSQSSLLALTLETEPTVAEFAGDVHRSSERALPPVSTLPAILKVRILFRPSDGRPAINLPSFRGRGRDKPDFPPLARRVEKGPITHAESSAAGRAPRFDLTFDGLHGGCQKALISLLYVTFFCAGNVRIF